MPFYPNDAFVPVELRTDEFLLRPLGAADVALDYEAVMAAQESLRLRTGGRWPHPGFTIEENLADLEGHEADFQARRGFTYTVMNPSETRCLGCVYIYPLEDDTAEPVRDDEAVIWFWIRPDGVPADRDRRLLAAIVPWLCNDFAFGRVRFRTWSNDERQTALLGEAGLQVVDTRPLGEFETLLSESRDLHRPEIARSISTLSERGVLPPQPPPVREGRGRTEDSRSPPTPDF